MYLIFYHIPKTSGTFLRDVFKHNDIECTFKGHKPCPWLNKKDVRLTFSIVRNPYSLITSLYFHADHGFADWNKRYGLNSFKKFVQFFCRNNPFSQGRVRPSIFGQIYNPTTDELFVNRVYKLEHYQVFLDDLGRILGKEIKLKEEFDMNLSRRMPRESSYKEYYDEDMKRLVYDTFRADFQKFGYNFEGSTSSDIIRNGI